MNGKRKLLMFFGQLVATAGLVAAGKMSGAEFVSMETLAIPVFVAGNVGEYLTKKNAPPETTDAGK